MAPTSRERHATRLVALGPDLWLIRDYLRSNSNLPGPRGNLELAHAFADWAPDSLVDALADDDDEFVRFCTVLAMGERLARDGDPSLVAVLRDHARDPRWRVREAVATGLQRVGDVDLPRLIAIVQAWAREADPLVQRAAIAAICEPRLLVEPAGASAALAACQVATDAIAAMTPQRRRDPEVRVLRQALGYCWSVAVVADPTRGLRALARVESSDDPDLAWIARENHRKARLQRLLSRQDAALA